MDDKTLLTFNLYLNLNPAQQAEFDKAYKDYAEAARADRIEKRTKINERANKLISGPLSGACAYCGK